MPTPTHVELLKTFLVSTKGACLVNDDSHINTLKSTVMAVGAARMLKIYFFAGSGEYLLLIP
jgi:hypothetical protein